MEAGRELSGIFDNEKGARWDLKRSAPRAYSKNLRNDLLHGMHEVEWSRNLHGIFVCGCRSHTVLLFCLFTSDAKS